MGNQNYSNSCDECDKDNSCTREVDPFSTLCDECDDKRDINKEIKEVFRAIAKELCDINKDIQQLNNLFCKLEKLLAERGCITSREKALICNIKKDIQALNCVLRETAKDIRCLEQIVL